MSLLIRCSGLSVLVAGVFAIAGLSVTGCGQNADKKSVTIVDETDHAFDETHADMQSPAMVEIVTDPNQAVTPEVAAPAVSTTTSTVTTTAPMTATATTAPAPATVKAPVAAPKGEVRFEVKVQLALQKAGYFKGTADGNIGSDTREAIRAFQKAQGLKADGMVGSATWEKLKPYYSGS